MSHEESVVVFAYPIHCSKCKQKGFIELRADFALVELHGGVAQFREVMQQEAGEAVTQAFTKAVTRVDRCWICRGPRFR